MAQLLSAISLSSLSGVGAKVAEKTGESRLTLGSRFTVSLTSPL